MHLKISDKHPQDLILFVIALALQLVPCVPCPPTWVLVRLWITSRTPLRAALVKFPSSLASLYKIAIT